MPHHDKIIEKELITFLSSTYTLYLKIQNFHWNITGPQFFSLHAFLDAEYHALVEAIDTIAERIRALDAFVPANFTTFQQLTNIPEPTATVLTEKEMVTTLLSDHETLCLEMKRLITACDKAQDLATQDLILERLRSHEKSIWMLKSLKC